MRITQDSLKNIDLESTQLCLCCVALSAQISHLTAAGQPVLILEHLSSHLLFTFFLALLLNVITFLDPPGSLAHAGFPQLP